MHTYNQMKESILKNTSKKSTEPEDLSLSGKPVSIVDEHDRKKLHEGRTYNMGFAFLKKLKNNKFEAAHATSPCKDYLNDVVYGEYLNQAVGACGLSYEPQGIFDKKTSYMTMKMLPANNNSSYYRPGTTLEKDIEMLEKNYKNIEKLINWVESKLDLPFTKITIANDGFYLIEFSYYWSSQTYLISLYTLLLRMAQFYNGINSPAEFLNEYKDPLDITLWNQARPRLFLLLHGLKPTQKFDPQTGGNIHSEGILSHKFNEFIIF